jgi:endonuclease/exonuclease/phosphatase family metal-dependent hydrolase
MFVLIFIILVITFAAFKLPLHDPEESEQLRRQYEEISSAIRNKSSEEIRGSNGASIPFPVMSFNVRLDALEKEPDNKFLKRLPRLVNVFKKWRPLIVGLQEPFNGQIMDLQRELKPDAAYAVIGYKRPGYTHEYASLGHPSRMHDYRTAILYNNEALELVFEDHVWLSDSPRVVESKYAKSRGIRTLTFGRFKVKPSYYNEHNSDVEDDIHVLAFNTHLDVWNEEARRFQARKTLEWIERVKAQYPNDPVFLFGDFNSAPGHQSHQILTSKLSDTWDTCNQLGSSECVTNSYANSYHHWMGPFLNTYGARVIQYILQTLHGGGCFVVMDTINWRSSLAALSNITMSAIREGLPTSLNRLHVDWILFDQPAASASSTPSEVQNAKNNVQVDLKFIAVVDTVATGFSSDHYPIAAMFELKYNKRAKSN